MVKRFMNIIDLNRMWHYTKDRKDRWKVHTAPDENGQIKGDCEDYACTAGYIESDCGRWKFFINVITGKLKLRGVGGHVVLWSNKRDQWIDNQHKRWMDKDKLPEKYKWSWRYPSIMVAIEIVRGGSDWHVKLPFALALAAVAAVIVGGVYVING